MAKVSSFPESQHQHWTTRHRGPYRFCVVRPSKGKTPHRTEWLSGEVSGDQVDEEAEALLTDPRDSIIAINVWSLKEEQYVWSYKG